MAEKKNGSKVSKTDAVGHALSELGKDASRSDIQKFVKDRFGYDMSPDHVSNCKSELRKRAKKKSAGRDLSAATQPWPKGWSRAVAGAGIVSRFPARCGTPETVASPR
jgi:hypothetical protein